MPAAERDARFPATRAARITPAREARTTPAREARITIDVRPRAGRNALDVLANGVVRACVAAPPADGAANEAVRSLLADALGCVRSAVEIVQGARARRKLIRIRGLSLAAVLARLGAEP